ncbi:hypothetical protein WH95_04235 [Kiloniella litopenaei]|uniref:Uncharacterized protein n=2 Tax=Kiloniella litopenaei TaxID=1549748 RepID=A0A0M2R720_9PROT|nr:hypothetical protein WH95_04235 [Kiloniella litopenaei]
MADFAEIAIFKIPENVSEDILKACVASGYRLGKLNEAELLNQQNGRAVQYTAISLTLIHSKIPYKDLKIRKHEVCSYQKDNSVFVEIMDNYVFFVHYVY